MMDTVPPVSGVPAVTVRTCPRRIRPDQLIRGPVVTPFYPDRPLAARSDTLTGRPGDLRRSLVRLHPGFGILSRVSGTGSTTEVDVRLGSR